MSTEGDWLWGLTIGAVGGGIVWEIKGAIIGALLGCWIGYARHRKALSAKSARHVSKKAS